MSRGLIDDERWDDALEAAVREAAVAADVPVALVAVRVDAVLWIAAHVGLPAELEVSRAVACDFSFSRAVLASGQPAVIPDASAHPDTRPELVDGFSLRSYAGVPVRVGGAVVGDFCVVDTRPRAFGDDTLIALLRLLPAVEQRLERRLAQRTAQPTAEVTKTAYALRPYLRLLEAVQVGALSADAMSRALRVLPPVPT